MTSLSTRFIVFNLLVHIIVCAGHTSSKQFLIDLFGNPIKDLQDTFENIKISLTKIPNTRKEDKPKKTDEDNADTQMIEVPVNAEKCRRGSVKDISGVCRTPWQ